MFSKAHIADGAQADVEEGDDAHAHVQNHGEALRSLHLVLQRKNLPKENTSDIWAKTAKTMFPHIFCSSLWSSWFRLKFILLCKHFIHQHHNHFFPVLILTSQALTWEEKTIELKSFIHLSAFKNFDYNVTQTITVFYWPSHDTLFSHDYLFF